MGKRVLVVDDEPGVRRLVQITLEQSERQYKVIEAGTGVEALTVLAQDPPDLVILDIRLPDVSGPDLCRQLRKHPATVGLPVVLISAVADDIHGADAYVAKPFSPSTLREVVERLLA